MVLEGVVTNVAAFGAFIDIGVHQDGLVHVSAMSKTFVKDPRDVVKPGDIVKVKVLDVDIPRKRISLTLRLDDEAAPAGGGQPGRWRALVEQRGGRPPAAAAAAAVSGGGTAAGAPPPANSAMADALRRAGLLDPKNAQALTVGGELRGRFVAGRPPASYPAPQGGSSVTLPAETSKRRVTLHRVQHPAVVRDQEQRALVGAPGPTPAARWPGRSRWLVGSSRTRRLTPRPWRRASAARVRSPGERVAAGRSTWSAFRPNLASRVRTSAGSVSGTAAQNASSRRLRAVEQLAGLVDLADQRRPSRGPACPASSGTPAQEGAEQGRLARAVRAGDRDPVRPVDLQGHRPEGEAAAVAPRRRAGWRRRRPERGAAAISIRSSHSLRGSSTTSRRSIMRWVWRAFAACFSLDSLRNLRPILSLSLALRRAFLTPLSIQERCIWARPSSADLLVGVLLEVLAGVPAGDVPLLQVGLVAAAVEVDLLLGEVEFEDLGDGAGQELAVVADDDRAGAQALHEALRGVPGPSRSRSLVGSSRRKTS